MLRTPFDFLFDFSVSLELIPDRVCPRLQRLKPLSRGSFVDFRRNLGGAQSKTRLGCLARPPTRSWKVTPGGVSPLHPARRYDGSVTPSRVQLKLVPFGRSRRGLWESPSTCGAIRGEVCGNPRRHVVVEPASDTPNTILNILKTPRCPLQAARPRAGDHPQYPQNSRLLVARCMTRGERTSSISSKPKSPDERGRSGFRGQVREAHPVVLRRGGTGPEIRPPPTYRPMPAAAFSVKRFASRIYRRTIATDRCPVCAMIARSDFPAFAADVASPARSE